MSDITNNDDIIDLRDVIARLEELESEREAFSDDIAERSAAGASTEEIRAELRKWLVDNRDEMDALSGLLDNCRGYGGDHQWRGDWYPVTLINDSYFEDYAQELADDIGAVDRNASWPNNCIDWERAALELQVDYTSVEFDGAKYWCR